MTWIGPAPGTAQKRNWLRVPKKEHAGRDFVATGRSAWCRKPDYCGVPLTGPSYSLGCPEASVYWAIRDQPGIRRTAQRAWGSSMATWQSVLEDIRRVQTEILWLRPTRGYGLRPNPGASERAILAAEHRIGRPLPPSYREFLAQSDGFPAFYEGASLLGTHRLGRDLYGGLMDAVYSGMETPVPDLAPPSPRQHQHRQLIPFGADLGATTLFAFHPGVMGLDGEYEVVCWINEIGVRCRCFEDFLRMVLDFCEDEVESLVEIHSAA